MVRLCKLISKYFINSVTFLNPPLTDLPGPFQSALRALLDDQGYASAVREVLKAGGNNCIREVVVGACLGAKYGLDEIPLTWFEKTDAAKEALELSLALVELVAV